MSFAVCIQASEGACRLSELKLWEISLVTFPMNIRKFREVLAECRKAMR
jgi:hypothetical protein